MINNTVRNDFIGLEEKIFFNNASYAPMLKPVKEKIDQYLGEVIKLRAAEIESITHLDSLRKNCAEMIGAEVSEIGFATNTSYGINLAVTGIDWQAGDEIIICENEFPSLPYPFKILEKKGVQIKYSPAVNRNFSLEKVAELITAKTRLLGVSFVQYFNGYRNDLKAIGDFCDKHNIFFLVDAIQGLGVCPLDVKKCKIDLLCCGSQKWLLSPLGSGFFYLSENSKIQLESYLTGWLGVNWEMDFTDLKDFGKEPFNDARRFNLGTYPYLQLWAMNAAVQYINKLGVENIYQHNYQLVDYLLSYIDKQDFYKLESSRQEQHRSQIVAISSPAGNKLVKYLINKGIYLVYREGAVRIALNFYNTKTEIDTLVDKLEDFKNGF